MALARDRKAEHIALALEQQDMATHHYFDDYALTHCALPQIDLDAIDLSTPFLGKTLQSPLLISCMTGGTDSARQINENLALAAEQTGIALGVGSQRKALESPEQAYTFEIRSLAPTVPILANLGAVQLNYGFGLKECEQAVAMVAADALVLHLNPLQEAIQPEGQCNFTGLLEKMADIAAKLSVPIIVKEVGSGISGALAAKLVAAGMHILDTAGVGGTSWARIEAARAQAPDLDAQFAHWGIPTPESIQQCKAIPGASVIASGGVRTGLDVAKAIAMGADLAGMASPFLAPAMESAEAVVETIERTTKALRIAMFCAGADSISALQHVEVRKIA